MSLRCIRTVASLLLVGAFAAAPRAAPLHAQAPDRRHEPRRAFTAPELERAARTVMADAGFAAFITIDAAGHPQSRTVQPVAPDSTMTVRFATNPHTRKVAEVRRNPRVTLHYFDKASLAYVSLRGRARIVTSRREKDAHWQAAWSGFYPDRDSSVVLVEVVPERIEVVDIKRGIEGDVRTWRPPTFTPRRP